MPSTQNLSLPISKEDKEPIYDLLYEAMVDALEHSTMTVEESEISAQYIYDNLDKVQTETELVAFLEETANLWPAYQNVYLQKKGQVIQSEDDDKLDEIKNKLSQFALT